MAGEVALRVPVGQVLVSMMGMAPRERGLYVDNIMRRWVGGSVDESCPQWVHEEWAKAERQRAARPQREGYYGREWGATRLAIIARDKTCRLCGTGGRLDVHHRIPRRKFQVTTEADGHDNLVALCRRCHRAADAEFNRSGKVIA